MVSQIDDVQDFDERIRSGKPVLVDFYATWCGPCRALAPVLEDVEREAGDRVDVVKVDIDRARGLAGRHGVMAVPTVILFEGGEEVRRFVGVQPKDAYLTAAGAR